MNAGRRESAADKRGPRAGKVRVQVWIDRAHHRALRILAIDRDQHGVEAIAGELLLKAIELAAAGSPLAMLAAQLFRDPPNHTPGDDETPLAPTDASLQAMERIIDGGLAANIEHRKEQKRT